jgi:hypothetical protein
MQYIYKSRHAYCTHTFTVYEKRKNSGRKKPSPKSKKAETDPTVQERREGICRKEERKKGKGERVKNLFKIL